MPSRIEGFKEMVAQDLSAFADPGTRPTFENDGNILGTKWQVHGKKREAMFTLKAGSRLRWMGPSGDRPYYSFLASEDMAGFDQLAQSCLAKIKSESDFVASDALIEEREETETKLLTPDALSEMIDGSRTQAEEGSSTQLFFQGGCRGRQDYVAARDYLAAGATVSERGE